MKKIVRRDCALSRRQEKVEEAEACRRKYRSTCHLAAHIAHRHMDQTLDCPARWGKHLSEEVEA